MAVEKRGGPNGGPQYNQANVKPMGGNGQSGRMDLNYSGLPYGQNKATNEQRTAAPTKAPSSNVVSPRISETSPLTAVTPITAETMMVEDPITNGAPIGDGANSVPNLPTVPSEDPDINMIRDYYPMLEFWASQPGTSQATKDYVQYLRTVI